VRGVFCSVGLFLLLHVLYVGVQVVFIPAVCFLFPGVSVIKPRRVCCCKAMPFVMTLLSTSCT
jgi:hypothetical protein